MSFWRKRPVVVEAFQWTGGEDQTEDPVWIVEAINSGKVSFARTLLPSELYMHISTLEGRMEATPGDWIIKGVRGEIYPCKPDIFALTYEPAPCPGKAQETTEN